MISSIIESLKKKGCKVLHNKGNLSAVVKCSNSYLVKSPSDQWNILIPSMKLLPLQKNLLTSIKPQNIESGKFIRTGSWSRMFDFNINNEVRYHFNEDTVKNSKIPKIKSIVDSMKDQEYFFNEDIREFDLQKDYRENVEKLSSAINDHVVSNLKKKFNKPIVCHSNPEIRKFWMQNGEKIIYRIKTTCLIPGSKQSIENVINSTLIQSTVSQSDVRYISSRMTKNNYFMLSGIQLFQKAIPYPLLKFTLKNDKIIEKNDFLSKIKEMESDFSSKKMNDGKNINIKAFTKFLF